MAEKLQRQNYATAVKGRGRADVWIFFLVNSRKSQ